MSTGGSLPTGGAPATGGSRPTGGALNTGGAVATGGSPPTGGSPATGGALPTGGIVGSGGFVSSGGRVGSGGSPDCATQCAAQGLACCNGACVNTNNDPYRCGGCDKVCPHDKFFCSAGQCGTPPCFSVPPPPLPDASVPNGPVPIGCLSTQTCCGNVCCELGQICCEVNLSITTYQCIDPGSGVTCPVGCPQCVCASPDTPIATPHGDRAIATLAVGDVVYSVDDGHVVAVPIVLVHRTAAPHHVVVHIRLSNGSVLDVSAPHPTADGRLFADLRAGDVLGGVEITSVTRVPYPFAFTYDILPASDTGTYFAGGVPVGSTLGGSALASGARDASALTLPR
jgi:hypothetical protein